MRKSNAEVMSRAEVHRRALLAAAAVALGTSSCGDATGTAVSAVDAQSTVDTAEVAQANDGSAGAEVADAASSDATATADAAVDAAVDVAAAKPDCRSVPPTDMGACCEALRVWCADAFGAETEAANTCHFGPGFDASTGCTPWGPPAPPAWTAPDRPQRALA